YRDRAALPHDQARAVRLRRRRRGRRRPARRELPRARRGPPPPGRARGVAGRERRMSEPRAVDPRPAATQDPAIFRIGTIVVAIGSLLFFVCMPVLVVIVEAFSQG